MIQLFTAWFFILVILSPLPLSAVKRVSRPPITTLIKKTDFPVVEREAVLMGTDIAVLIATDDKIRGNEAIDAALKEIARVENLMTDWREDSELQAINRDAGLKPAQVSSEIIFVLLKAREISELTQGGFDVTYAALGKLWGNFVTTPPRIPSSEEIAKVLPLVDYHQLEIDAKKGTAFLRKSGMRVGLGGIAKGYAVDRAAQVIEKFGFPNFALKAGGDLTVHGRKQGKLWWVGIQDPRDRNKNIAILPAANSSISTSGDYERFFMMKGKRYAHILNPHTGKPVDYCRSVTLISRNAIWTDGLATGVFVLGPEKGMKLIESLPYLDGMIVDGEGHVSISKGLQKQE